MIVVDASALVDVLVDSPRRDACLAHMHQPLVAPAHQPAEVLSAVARLVRAGSVSTRAARRALREMAQLEQELVEPDEGDLVAALAGRENVRVLDGLYVALALRRRCPLLTTDRRLHDAGPACEVVLVG